MALGAIGAGTPGPAAYAATTATPTHTVDLSNDEVTVPAVPASRLSTPRSTTHSTTDSTSTGVTVETVYVSRLAVTTSTKDDTNGDDEVDDATIKAAVASMHDYWWEQSSHTVDIQLGGIEDDSLGLSTCSDPGAALDGVAKTAFKGAFANYSWQGTHKHLIALSKEACGTQAFGTVGGLGGEIFSGNGGDQTYGVPVLLHEFGHNLGFKHSGSAICRSSTEFDGLGSDFAYADEKNDSVLCPVLEYGDYSDIMGYSLKGARPGLSSVQRSLAGYLSDVEADDTAGSTQTFTVAPLSGSSGSRSLQVTDPVTGAVYYVEYRTKAGGDSTDAEFGGYLQNCDKAYGGYTKCSLGSSASTGIVRIMRTLDGSAQSGTYPATFVLATSPDTASDPSRRDTRLYAGQSFTDYGSGVTIAVKSLTPASGAVVTVSIAAPEMPGDEPAPADKTSAPSGRPGVAGVATTTTLALNRASQTYGSTTTATATAAATLADGSGDAAHGAVTFSRNGRTVSTVALDAYGRASYRLPSTTSAGTQKVTASFTPADASAETSSSSGSTTVTVKKAAPSVRSSLAATKVSRSTTPKLTVAVSATGVSAPTGTLTVKAGGKTIKTYTLPSSKKGRVILTLPKFAKTGRYSIKASYAGTSNISSGTAKSLVLTVK